jgi:hypothetical protein
LLVGEKWWMTFCPGVPFTCSGGERLPGTYLVTNSELLSVKAQKLEGMLMLNGRAEFELWKLKE